MKRFFSLSIFFILFLILSNWINSGNILKVKEVRAVSATRTFQFTGSQQIFNVPTDVSSIDVVLNGAGGQTGGGPGGRINARLTVTPGENLYINVGGTNGFNGGGTAGVGGGSGGGASDIRRGGQALSNRVFVAAGGGGYSSGGAGGGATGGAPGPGAGGTQSAGGTPGGDLGIGGSTPNSQGGGGGGYYGGGSGNQTSYDECDDEGSCNTIYVGSPGGGGGSSFAIGTATNVANTLGGGAGSGNNGSVTITYDSSIAPTPTPTPTPTPIVLPPNTVVFCMVPSADPWYQTDLGDVRTPNLKNEIPAGQFGSTDDNYPGIFFSSGTYITFGSGGTNSVSPNRKWLVNNEYFYNKKSENRNGSMSYSFYKSKASQSGAKITNLNYTGFVNISDLDPGTNKDSAIFESPGNLTIGSPYTVPNGKRVVLLVNGNVTINSKITVPKGSLLIIAAKGNIIVDASVGTANLGAIAPSDISLEGYYTAEGNIEIKGNNDCSASPAVPDKRLIVAGALVANADRPFAKDTFTGGKVDFSERDLCGGNANAAALLVTSRYDFLTQLSDFYKTSYTKWEEQKP